MMRDGKKRKDKENWGQKVTRCQLGRFDLRNPLYTHLGWSEVLKGWGGRNHTPISILNRSVLSLQRIWFQLGSRVLTIIGFWLSAEASPCLRKSKNFCRATVLQKNVKATIRFNNVYECMISPSHSGIDIAVIVLLLLKNCQNTWDSNFTFQPHIIHLYKSCLAIISRQYVTWGLLLPKKVNNQLSCLFFLLSFWLCKLGLRRCIRPWTQQVSTHPKLASSENSASIFSYKLLNPTRQLSWLPLVFSLRFKMA